MFETIKYEKTNNLVLRWIGNMAEHPAHWLLIKALDAEERDNIKLCNFYVRPANFLYNNFVYRWATFYELVLDDEEE